MLRTCQTCTAIVVGRSGTPPRECPFCKTAIEQPWEKGARKLLMTSALVLGATALANPWTSTLVSAEGAATFSLGGAPRPLEVLLLQALSWGFLVSSAWVLTRTGKTGAASGWLCMAAVGWACASLLALPPGSVPYELSLAPSELGGVLGSMVQLSGAALLFLGTLGELALGHFAFNTVH